MKPVAFVNKRSFLTRNRQAVSPAIATMYILLVVVGLTMMYIGIQFPAIQKLDAESNYKTTLGYFQALDQDLHTLSTESVGSTRMGMLPAGHTGTLGVKTDEQAWVYTYQYRPDSDIRIEILEYVEGKSFDSIYRLHVNDASGNTTPDRWNGWEVDIYWPQSNIEPGLGKPITETHSQVALDESIRDTMRVVVNDENGDPVAGAWIFCTDTIFRTFSNSAGSFILREESGGLSSDFPDKPHVESPPEIITGERGITVRTIQFDGGGSVSRGKYQVQMSHLDKHVAIEEGIYDLQLQIYGEYRDMWYSYLTSAGTGYSSTVPYGFSMQGDIEYLDYILPMENNPEGRMDLKLLSNMIAVNFQAV